MEAIFQYYAARKSFDISKRLQQYHDSSQLISFFFCGREGTKKHGSIYNIYMYMRNIHLNTTEANEADIYNTNENE